MTHLFSTPTLLNSNFFSLRCTNLVTYASLIIRISSLTNTLIAVGVPVVLVVFIGAYRTSVHEIHHGLLATIASMFVASHNKYLVMLS